MLAESKTGAPVKGLLFLWMCARDGRKLGGESPLRRLTNGAILRERFDYPDHLVVTGNQGAQWELLASQLWELLEKAESLGRSCLNDRKAALLPLARSRPVMQFLDYLADGMEEEPDAIRILSDYCRENSGQMLLPLLAEYEQNAGSHRKKTPKKILKKIRTVLTSRESLPLHRALYRDLKSAAGEYPSLRDHHSGEAWERQRISQELQALGYAGEYPSFRKLAPLKGVRLVGGLERIWIVFREKYLASLITCHHTHDEERKAATAFSCSTVFLTEDELPGFSDLDGWSGFFDSRRPHQGWILFPKEAGDRITDLAVRTAELEPLDRKDRTRLLTTGSFAPLLLILLTMILAGSLFGGGMLLVTVLITGILSLAETGTLGMVGELMQAISPAEIFLLTGIPYGIAMGIFTALMARRVNG